MKKNISIDNKIIGSNSAPYIIAEIGLNHNNDIELAKKMIASAKEHGADAVKFQTFITEKLFSDKMEIFPLIKSLELSKEKTALLSEYSKEVGITFFSTPLCLECISWLSDIKVPAYKIASSDLDFLELIEKCAETGKPVILSTGMSGLPMIKKAVKTVEKTGNKNIIILHTITKYPPDYKDMDLNFISMLKNSFDYPVGFSDHSLDNLTSVCARTLGASVFEKHFTLSKTLPGPDHQISLEPADLLDLRKKLTAVDEMFKVHENERSDAHFEKGARRGLFASRDIKAGEKINEGMIDVIRPKAFFPPAGISKITGRKLKKDMKKGDAFDLTCF
jgi:N,N'-diacetyllegionaminate synthase